MTVLSNVLADLAERVRELDQASIAAELTATEKAMEAGRLLVEAKDGCPHGAWLPFLSRAGVPERRAQRLMQLARSGLKSDTVTDLGGIKAALRYIATCRLPGEGKWLIVDRAREDADDQLFAYAVIKPAARQDFFEVLVHATGKTNIYWPIRAGRVWDFIDQKLPIPISERIFVSSHADNSHTVAPQDATTMIGNLPWSYERAKGKIQDCTEDFTQEKFATANEALGVVMAESWWWPTAFDAWEIIADDLEMEELCDRMFDLARQHEMARSSIALALPAPERSS